VNIAVAVPEHAQRLIEGLEAHGWKYDEVRRVAGQPFTFAIFSNVMGYGKACPDGVIAKLAVALPDDPQTPPPGFHMHPPLGIGSVTNTSNSPLSTQQEQWSYWSRPLKDWAVRPDAARIASHFSSALRDA
jgi:hypothetical protein